MTIAVKEQHQRFHSCTLSIVPLFLQHKLDYMIITIEVFDLHALNLLRELEQLNVLRLVPVKEEVAKQSLPEQEKFTAISLDTLGFKFNRDEANER